MVWPPRSPDLDCDFFLWGYLKSKVYTTPPNDIDDLRARIHRKVAALAGDQVLVRRTVQSMRVMRRRCELCIESNGEHVEGDGS